MTPLEAAAITAWALVRLAQIWAASVKHKRDSAAKARQG